MIALLNVLRAHSQTIAQTEFGKNLVGDQPPTTAQRTDQPSSAPADDGWTNPLASNDEGWDSWNEDDNEPWAENDNEEGDPPNTPKPPTQPGDWDNW